jgi:micrococcal nuclease
MRLVPAALRATLLALAVPALSLALPSAGTITLPATVTRVVDGDTIHASSRGFDTTVRLLGIDTPETKRPETVVQCGGPAASRRAERLLPPGQPVTLVTDPTQATRDRFGRLLAYVYLPGRRGPTGSVNYALVAGGFARVFIFHGVPFRNAGPFLRAQAAARRARLGIWGPPCNGNTTKPDPGA